MSRIFKPKGKLLLPASCKKELGVRTDKAWKTDKIASINQKTIIF
jgi:hypothetical protein